MATAATMWNNTATQNVSALSPRPMDNASGGSNPSNPSTITANDFLTLLVTEMQNQDPTSATDPNEYINQLVSVNSLEQLIQINQTLLLGLAASSSGTSDRAGSSASPAFPTQTTARTDQAAPAAVGLPAQTSILKTPGNLSVPNTNPAARRVAQALGGRANL